MPLSDSQLIGVQVEGYFILNAQSLEIEKSNMVAMFSEYAALNAADGELYFLYPLAQPSRVAYTLRKIYLSTDELSPPLTGRDQPINGPIIYDDKGKVIVSGGGFRIFSTSGELVDEVGINAITSKIFVK